MEGFGKTRAAAAAARSEQSGSLLVPSSAADLLLTSRAPRRAVSVLTCWKLCGVCFVAGIVVGFTLKRRLRNWAASLLRRIKDD